MNEALLGKDFKRPKNSAHRTTSHRWRAGTRRHKRYARGRG